MIDPRAFTTLSADHPVLAGLDERLQELLRDELEPGEALVRAVSAKISGSQGALVLTERRLFAVWVTRLLFFLRLPTVQEFAPSQLTQIEERPDGTLYLFATADPTQPHEDYEEGLFELEASARAALVADLRGAAAPA